jgi:voltage-dependent calcium channel N type alpha-1B
VDFFCSLDIDEMDKADEELRETIKKLWPLQSAKKINLLVPPKDGKLNLNKIIK